MALWDLWLLEIVSCFSENKMKFFVPYVNILDIFYYFQVIHIFLPIKRVILQAFIHYSSGHVRKNHGLIVNTLSVKIQNPFYFILFFFAQNLPYVLIRKSMCWWGTENWEMWRNSVYFAICPSRWNWDWALSLWAQIRWVLSSWMS